MREKQENKDEGNEEIDSFVNEAFLFTAFHQVGQKSGYLLNELLGQLCLGVCFAPTGRRPVIWSYVRGMLLRG